jgi:RNA polymerase sigma-54 factor
MDEQVNIIPDFKLIRKDADFILSYNDAFTQEIVLDEYFKSNNNEIKEKIKEAKDLIDLLELRKETLHKIVLIIIDVQKEFFDGKSLKPLIMQQIADELSFTESTISRAISNKYLECNRGIFPLKHFFSNQVQKEELSSNEIKQFLIKTIKDENREKPYSDEALIPIINSKFSIKLSRRAITKYRLSLNILSSRDRKKIYQLKSL